jgi:hypothetical protein
MTKPMFDEHQDYSIALSLQIFKKYESNDGYSPY